MRIAILIGSTRPGRRGPTVADWLLEQARKRPEVVSGEVTYEILDLADYDLPLLAEPTIPGAANREYENEKTRAWSRAVDSFQAFVWVTPEYNHGVPAAMKNGLDVLYPEWNHKAVSIVSYGADGGVRAAEQWRVIHANVHLHATRGFMALSSFFDWDGSEFKPLDRRVGEAESMLGELNALAHATNVLRY